MDNPKSVQKRNPALVFFSLSGSLVLVIAGGGLFIAWLSQGSLFYGHQALQVKAKVVANAPGAMGDTPEDQRHFLVLSYAGCETVRHGLRVPAATGVQAKYAAMAAEIRACLLPLKPGRDVNLDMEVREARLTGKRTWRVKGVEGCDVTPLEVAIKTEGEERCTWM